MPAAACPPMGEPGTAGNRPLDGDTVFEIGSITKVLTALILADMDERGEVTMADPVAKYLPASVKVPDYQGTPITLLDLATYTSGLPDLPDNFALNPLDPHSWILPYVAAARLAEDVPATTRKMTLYHGKRCHGRGGRRPA